MGAGASSEAANAATSSRRSSSPSGASSASSSSKANGTPNDATSATLSLDLGATVQDIAAQLVPYYNADPERFHNIISAMQAAGRNTAPRFPGGICVADIPHEPDQAGLVAKHTSDEYHPIDQPEGEERSRIARELQYKRWKWATTNVNRYINILRAVGHDDERIQRMLEGIPMCFRNAESYTALRKGLAQLAPAVEAEMGWSNCSFVFTGSCVPGFSQNPRKGIRDLPSKITHPTNSDVDICIVADGVFCTVSRLHTEPNSSGEPVHAFPTTCRPFMSGMRYGCKDLRAFCKSAADFQDKWASILPGGLQLTFAEDDGDTPPWEARVPLDELANDTATAAQRRTSS